MSATAAARQDSVLELRGIGKDFGAIRALSDVDLAIAPGEVVGLMGDNGAGKSTLVKIIAGNFHPTTARSGSTARSIASTARSTPARPGSRSSTRTSRSPTTCRPPPTSSSAAS